VRPLVSILAVALIAAGLAAATPQPAQAAKAPVYTGFASSLAVGGYDPVAYFTTGRPVEGSSAFSLTWQGATFRFASAANRDLFRASPARYAPQFGGYCAWAVSQGYTAPGDPRYWRIVDGRLYLNYDARVQRRWEADIPGFITRAQANWPSVLQR
jgi:YHS domain-containing protein